MSDIGGIGDFANDPFAASLRRQQPMLRLSSSNRLKSSAAARAGSIGSIGKRQPESA